MRKYMLIALISIFYACGIIEDTNEKKYQYTYILKNGTGTNVIVTGDYPQRIEELQNGESYSCSFYSSVGHGGGICQNYVFFFFPEINKGYRCIGAKDDEGLCFKGGEGLFTRLDGTIFSEISSGTYEYVLTPELLESAYELPSD
ncbi:MAG: hypothetical protein COA50_05500 [Flavobacteriaceae bacterium]|nr:MAG: hypothetical protein COA50_05500 [Flavobacteriaceae bacterium]